MRRRSAQHSLCAALVGVCGFFPAGRTHAQETPPPAHSQAVQEIVVTGQKPVKPRQVRRPAPAQPAAQPVQSAATSANGSANGPPLQQVPQAGKTGTPIGDLPQSVVEVPRALVAEQGGTSLRDAIYTDRAETGMEGGDAGPFDASASRASQFAGKDNESDLLKRTSPCTSAESRTVPRQPIP